MVVGYTGDNVFKPKAHLNFTGVTIYCYFLLGICLFFCRTAQAAAPRSQSAAFHILDRHSTIGASSATPTRSALCLLLLSQFQRHWEGRGDGFGGGPDTADGADVAGPQVIMPCPSPLPGPGHLLCEACSAVSVSGLVLLCSRTFNPCFH